MRPGWPASLERRVQTRSSATSDARDPEVWQDPERWRALVLEVSRQGLLRMADLVGSWACSHSTRELSHLVLAAAQAGPFSGRLTVRCHRRTVNRPRRTRVAIYYAAPFLARLPGNLAQAETL
jgi:hypothetical protein